MNAELLYFEAIGDKSSIVIYVVAPSKQIAEEIANYFYKDSFSFFKRKYNSVPLQALTIFTSYNLTQGYYVYGDTKPVAYVSRKDMLDEILIDL